MTVAPIIGASFHFSLPPVVALPAHRSLLHNSPDSFSFKISRTTGIFAAQQLRKVKEKKRILFKKKEKIRLA